MKGVVHHVFPWIYSHPYYAVSAIGTSLAHLSGEHQSILDLEDQSEIE